MLERLLAPVTLLATQTAARALNLALAKDPGALRKLHALRDCVLEIHLRNLDLSLFVVSHRQKLEVLTRYPESTPSHCTVRLSGSVSALLALRDQSARARQFRSGALGLSGDAVRIQQIIQLVEALDIDWEGLLADMLGDIPAHALGTGLRRSWQWGQQVRRNLWRDLEEYLKFELRLLPTRPGAIQQFQAIEQLHQATERLDARARELMQKLRQPN
jgi:ubiquinone biosynthesis protein UbiJ